MIEELESQLIALDKRNQHKRRQQQRQDATPERRDAVANLAGPSRQTARSTAQHGVKHSARANSAR